MGAFGVFLMRQFFDTVPSHLLEAARIDGMSEFGILWWGALPLVRTIFTFPGNDTSVLWPLVIQKLELRTLPMAWRY